MKKWSIGSVMLLSSLAAQGADLSAYMGVEGQIHFYLEGKIEKGDRETFKEQITNLIEQGYDVDTVLLNSNGGLLQEAIWMALTVKSLGLNTTVLDDDICASACVTILSAGKNVQIDPKAKVGVHQAAIDGTVSEKATALLALVQIFLKFPAHLNEKLISTPPDKLYWLTPRDKQSLRKGQLPHRIEPWDIKAHYRDIATGSASAETYRIYGGIAQLGLGIDRDTYLALQYYLEGAKKGDGQSLYQMSLYYLDGVDVEQDLDTGIKYLEQSSEKHDGLARFVLGERDSAGFSAVEYQRYWRELTQASYDDRIRGGAWRKLAEQSEERGDMKKAIAYYKNGSAFGDPGAQYQYGRLLQTRDNEEDQFNGMMWVMTACAGGEEDACEDVENFLKKVN